MTKEMRPSHRIDVLCSALIFYGIKSKEKLSMFLAIKGLNVTKHLNDAFISVVTLDSMEKST